MSQKKTSITLTDEGLKLLALIAQRYGISRTAMLEVIIREKARNEGIEQAKDLRGDST